MRESWPRGNHGRDEVNHREHLMMRHRAAPAHGGALEGERTPSMHTPASSPNEPALADPPRAPALAGGRTAVVAGERHGPSTHLPRMNATHLPRIRPPPQGQDGRLGDLYGQRGRTNTSNAPEQRKHP